jgi:hypothetical protein
MSSSARAHSWNQRQALIRPLQPTPKQGDAHMGQLHRVFPLSFQRFQAVDSQLFVAGSTWAEVAAAAVEAIPPQLVRLPGAEEQLVVRYGRA